MASSYNYHERRYPSPESRHRLNFRTQAEQMLYNAVTMVEMAMEMKEKTTAGEKYVCYLRTLAVRAGKVVMTMQNSGRSFLLLSQKLCANALKNLENTTSAEQMKQEYEKLLNVIEKEMCEIEDIDAAEQNLSSELNSVCLNSISEKIRYLETKQKLSTDANSLPPTNSTKSVKSDIDEKYPESWSRESLIDLNNVVNLPPVPEDIFTGFSKPVKTSSLSSLKSLRKVKLYLQRAENTSEDDDSESDEPDTSRGNFGGDATNLDSRSPAKSAVLGNITEETTQD